MLQIPTSGLKSEIHGRIEHVSEFFRMLLEALSLRRFVEELCNRRECGSQFFVGKCFLLDISGQESTLSRNERTISSRDGRIWLTRLAGVGASL